MRLALVRLSFALALVAFFAWIVTTPTRAAITDACGGKSHPATQAEVEALGGQISVGTPICPGDTALGFTQDAGAAKQYLFSIARDLRNSQAPPTKERIDALNNTFAICAANFLKSYIKQYGTVNVVSAFRCGPISPATIKCDRGENQRAGGAGESNHQTGLAIDVNPAGSGSSYETMWAFAKSNPKFGVCFPYLGGDRPHMTLAGSKTGEAAKCAAQGVSQPCNGLAFTPTNPPPGTTVTPTGTTPSSGITNALRNLFSPGQPILPPPPMQQQMPYGPQPMPMPYSPTAVPAQQPSQVGTSPTTNFTSSDIGSPVAINTNQRPVSESISSSINNNSNRNSNATSAIDSINAIAGMSATSVPIGTAIAIDLNDDVRESTTTVMIEPRASTTGIIFNASGTVIYIDQMYMPQTFQSDDLSNSLSIYTPQQVSTFQQVLNNLRSTLMQALSFLQPFGGHSQHTDIH